MKPALLGSIYETCSSHSKLEIEDGTSGAHDSDEVKINSNGMEEILRSVHDIKNIQDLEIKRLEDRLEIRRRSSALRSKQAFNFQRNGTDQMLINAKDQTEKDKKLIDKLKKRAKKIQGDEAAVIPRLSASGKAAYLGTIRAVAKFKSMKKEVENAKEASTGDSRSTKARQTRSMFENGVFNSMGTFKRRWDFSVLLILFYIAIVVPYRASFAIDVDTTVAKIGDYIDYVLDFILLLDIIIRFNTATTVNDKIVTNRKIIAQRYVKSWFIIDFVSMIPFELIFKSVSHVGDIIKLPRLVRVLKLLRLVKLVRVAQLPLNIQRLSRIYGFNQQVLRVVKVALSIFYFNHLAACFWFMIPNMSDEIHPRSWIAVNKELNKTSTDQYISSTYWAFSVLASVGFGDLKPFTISEKMYTIVVMALGFSWYAFIVSAIGRLISGVDSHNSQSKAKMNDLRIFMRDADLPVHLRTKLTEHSEQVQNLKYDVDEILSEFPSALRLEVLLFLHRHVISSIAYLKGKSPHFQVELASRIKPLFVATGDCIIQEAAYAEEMFFLVTGKCVVQKGFKVVGSLPAGAFFGEIGCIMSDRRQTSVYAAEICELYTLSKKDLIKIIQQFPDFAAELREKAVSRLIMNANRQDCSKETVQVDLLNEQLQKIDTAFENKNPLLSTLHVNSSKKMDTVTRHGSREYDEEISEKELEEFRVHAQKTIDAFEKNIMEKLDRVMLAAKEYQIKRANARAIRTASHKKCSE